MSRWLVCTHRQAGDDRGVKHYVLLHGGGGQPPDMIAWGGIYDCMCD